MLGLITEGESLAEDRDMAADAIRTYLESLAKGGLSAPEDKPLALEPVKESVRITL